MNEHISITGMDPGVAVIVTAHPDDVAFFHSFLVKELVDAGWSIHILLATKGDMGAGGGTVRWLEELDAAAEVGIPQRHVTWMGFGDGTLCKNMRRQLMNFVREYCKKVGCSMLISFDDGGVYGHDDHIVISRALQMLLMDEEFAAWQHALLVCADPTVETRWCQTNKDIFIWPRQPKFDEIGLRFGATTERLELRERMISCHQSQKPDWNRFEMRHGDCEAYRVITRQ